MVRPISALRYSSTRYPGFGLSNVSDYQTPAAPAAPQAVAATGDGGGGGAATAELIDPNREGREEGSGPPRIGAPATAEQAFQTNKFLSNPLAQVAAAALPFPINLFAAATRAVTGPLAPADRQTYNAARMSPDEERGLTPDEAGRVAFDPYFGMNKSDVTSAGGEGGLTERGAAGNLGAVEVTSEPIANATPGAPQTYQGPAQTAPAAVTGGETGGGGSVSSTIGDIGGSRVDDSGPSGARDEIAPRDGGGGGVNAGGDSNDPKIICTELFRQNLMPLEERMWSYRGTMTLCSATALRGYHYWGIPVVHAIRRGKWRRFWTLICRSRSRELAYQIGLRSKPDYVGKLARLLVEPVSFVIGTIMNVYDRVPDFGALYTDQYPRI